MRKDVVRVALIALASYAACALIQSKMQVPLLGPYLPGGVRLIAA